MARGLLVDDSPAEMTSWLAARRRELPADRLTVLVDTTTFNNARDALYPTGRAPSAIGLLDLSVLTAAATLFDAIVMQPERFAPLEDTRDLTEVLHPSGEGHQELQQIYRDVWENVSAPDEVAMYAARSANFLGIPSDELQVDLEPIRTLSAEMTFDYSSTEQIAEAFGRTRGREASLALPSASTRSGPASTTGSRAHSGSPTWRRPSACQSPLVWPTARRTCSRP